MITLGKKYKDKITGFEGVATGYVKYLTGCNQVLLAPKVSATGAIGESVWMDEQRLDEQSDEAIVLDNGKTPGADKAPPNY